MKRVGLLTAVLLILSFAVMARQYSKTICKTKACSLKADFGQGQMVLESWLTGACRSCQKVVEIHWAKPENRPATQSIWNPETGKTKDLFSCPHCKKLVVSIKRRQEFKYCPKCNNRSVEVGEPFMMDD